jgi:hypothetical protein
VLNEASISGKVDPPSLKLRRASHLRGSPKAVGERNGVAGQRWRNEASLAGCTGPRHQTTWAG